MQANLIADMAIPWGYYTAAGKAQVGRAARGRLSGCSLDAGGGCGGHRGRDLLADRLPELFRSGEAVLQPPLEDRLQDGGERQPLASQPVLGAKGVLAVDDPLDEAVLLEALHAAGAELGTGSP